MRVRSTWKTTATAAKIQMGVAPEPKNPKSSMKNETCFPDVHQRASPRAMTSMARVAMKGGMRVIAMTAPLWRRTRSRPRWRALLALPRTVGTHPETGKAILAGIGRYGPWLKHGAVCVALPEDEDVLAVGLNRAVMLVDTA